MSGMYSKLLKYLGKETSNSEKKAPLFGLRLEPENDQSYLPVIPASSVALEIKELQEAAVRLEKRMEEVKYAKLSVTRKAVEDYEIASRRLKSLQMQCSSMAISLLDVNIAQLADCISFFNRMLMNRLMAGRVYEKGANPFVIEEGRFCAADLLDFQRFLAAAFSHLIIDRLSQPLEPSTLQHLVSTVIKLAQTLLKGHGDMNGFAGISLSLLNPAIRRLLIGKMTSAHIKALEEFDAILSPSDDYSNYFNQFHITPGTKAPAVPWFLPFAIHIESLLQLYSESSPLTTTHGILPQLSPPGRTRLASLLGFLAPSPAHRQISESNPHPLLSHWLLGLPFLSQAQLWKISLLACATPHREPQLHGLSHRSVLSLPTPSNVHGRLTLLCDHQCYT
ncbi:hypothetical protein DSO57_1004070 [Entomophthora muscae]|uniref:Uncharacterized protein n=1 Tax=Entomophthora muscae TaxID=34485 RepID=A0ACC2U6X4_9FUNG|nr:hypothetical protein DSO57_1004070 [Entomophthora muscae]